MNKERLKQFKDILDFLDDSADMDDHHRLIDTLENLYEDGELDWIHRYAKEKTRRVEELEMKYENIGAIFTRQSMRGRIQVLERENKRYRKKLEHIANKPIEQGTWTTQGIDCVLTARQALEGDPHD